MKTSALVISALLGSISAQQVGNYKAEYHLPLHLSECTSTGCTKETKGVVMDANWRWIHKVGDYKNCYEGVTWDKNFCPDNKSCAKDCALEGVPKEDWNGVYGTTSDGDSLNIGFVDKSGNIGARTYMMDTDSQYQEFKLLNKEFTFTADVANLPCGLNGALYFVSMNKNGDIGGDNAAGAKYGTGYCDAQCPNDVKFINGEANSEGWKDGAGKYGSCCAELDIWEANSVSEAYTSHPCTIDGQHKCSGQECGNPDRYGGVCDKDGCDLNPYRVGVEDFFGKGQTIDTSKPVTVVTQFHTDDGTDTGNLSEIVRFFVQEGKVFGHPESKIDKLSKQYTSITDDMCEKTKGIFGDQNDHKKKGGLAKMGQAMKNGMVLVMSLWDDHSADMLWLDSTYPVDKTSWGGPRGSCATSSGKPSDVEKNSPHSNVKFSDIKVGGFNTTFPGVHPGPTPPGPTPSNCPGGSLSACIGLCPSQPDAYKACVGVCVERCSGDGTKFLY